MRRKTRGPNHSPSCTPASVVGGGEVFGPLLAWPSFVINRLDRGIHPASLRQRRPKRCTVYSATLLCIDLGRCLTVGQGGHGARGAGAGAAPRITSLTKWASAGHTCVAQSTLPSAAVRLAVIFSNLSFVFVDPARCKAWHNNRSDCVIVKRVVAAS